jgi:hypothetical protein
MTENLVAVDETIRSLIRRGNLSVAVQVFEILEPRNKEGIVENLVSAIIKENRSGNCGEEVLKLRKSVGKGVSQDEADEILRPYFDVKNISHRPCYRSVNLDIVRIASRENVLRLLDMAFADKATAGDGFKGNLYEILKQKLKT